MIVWQAVKFVPSSVQEFTVYEISWIELRSKPLTQSHLSLLLFRAKIVCAANWQFVIRKRISFIGVLLFSELEL